MDKSVHELLQKKPNNWMETMMAKSDLPLKSKRLLSKMLAKDKYLYKGVTSNYITENGEQACYTPTKEDIELRNNRVALEQSWQYFERNRPIIFGIWTGVAAASLLVGALSPIQKATPSQRSNHDRV